MELKPINSKLEIIEKVYESKETKRFLYKVANSKLGIFYALKGYALSHNNVKDIGHEIISLNKSSSIKVHFAFEQDGVFFVAMDWQEGVSSSKFFKFPIKNKDDFKARIIFAKNTILELESLHKQRLWHRDLKPENILIIDKNLRKVKIIDFGLCALKPQANEGTLIFQSPEQQRISNKPIINAQTDIFSLGKIFYFWFTGKYLSLIPNDDFDNWLDFTLEKPPFNCNAKLYDEILKEMLSFNAKDRPPLTSLRPKLESLQKSL